MTQLLMPKATAVWLIDNSALTFEQIGAFCNLHPLEVQSIADGEAGIGIQGYDPVINGQITRAELDRCEADSTANLKLAEYAALGLPIVSTFFGARGGVLEEGAHYVVAAPEHLAEALREVLAMPMLSRHEMTVAANLRVRQTLDWQTIAKDYAVFLIS